MTEPKTVHVWMPDGRSLCDRRARVRFPDREKVSDAEWEALEREQSEAPMCGSCLVVAGHLRYRALIELENTGRRVYPSSVRDGWEGLRGTRWHTNIGDLEEFLENDLSADTYDALAFALSPEVIHSGLKRRQELRAHHNTDQST